MAAQRADTIAATCCCSVPPSHPFLFRVELTIVFCNEMSGWLFTLSHLLRFTHHLGIDTLAQSYNKQDFQEIQILILTQSTFLL